MGAGLGLLLHWYMLDPRVDSNPDHKGGVSGTFNLTRLQSLPTVKGASYQVLIVFSDLQYPQ